MQNGECPRCHTRTVYRSIATNTQGGLTTGDGSPLIRIYKENRWVPDIDLLTLTVYLCRSCGYVETYVSDLGRLEKLDDCTNWSPV